ncbi:MAG: aldo/keto reductase [Anaerolineae bacterium]|nr:MAG: aldo/keto reductase [Anaerolineae bacterium]
MDMRKLGRTGLMVSELCMGTMQFGWTADEPTSHEVLTAGWEAGINFIDTANVYSRWVAGNPGGVAETYIGNWMTKNNIPRDRLVLATKVRGQMSDDPLDQGLSRRHILQAVEDSLRRLQTDHIDLYQAHSPDDKTPIDETLRAMDDLVRQGKVLYVGVSNFKAWQLMEALWASDSHNTVRVDCIQPRYHLLHRAEFERELATVCRKYEVGVIPYSPLAGGFLTGKYRRGQDIPENSRGKTSQTVQGYMNDRGWAVVDLLESMGREKGGKSISQMALAWQLSDPLITSPIIGPKDMEQFNDNIGAAGLRLSPEEKTALDTATKWD